VKPATLGTSRSSPLCPGKLTSPGLGEVSRAVVEFSAVMEPAQRGARSGRRPGSRAANRAGGDWLLAKLAVMFRPPAGGRSHFGHHSGASSRGYRASDNLNSTIGSMISRPLRKLGLAT